MAKNKLANNLYQEVQVLIKQQAILFLRLGKALKSIRDDELFAEYNYDTFGEFLNSPEISLRQSTAYLYIRIYEFYQLELGMKEEEIVKTPLNRLMRMMPHLKTMDKEKAVETVEEITGLTNYDYDQEIKERNMVSDRPSVYECKECNKYRIEYDEKSICQCDDYFHLINKTVIDG